MVSRYITLVPSLGLRIGPACDCEAGLSVCNPKRERKKRPILLGCETYTVYINVCTGCMLNGLGVKILALTIVTSLVLSLGDRFATL